MRKPLRKTFKVCLFALTALAIAGQAGGAVMAKGAPKAHPQAQAPAPAPAPTELTWSNDLRSALATAKSQRRWVLVDCYTQSCGWCKRLDRDTFHNPDVARQLGNHFVWVKCDVDDPVTGVWVKSKYSTEVYPSILILDPYGTEKGRILGYLRPDQFVDRVARIVSR